MARNLYKANNIAGFTLNAIATGGLLVGGIVLAQPWMIAAAIPMTVGLTALSVKTQKKLFENSLTLHEESTDDSPNLGKIAKELYQASGLKADQFPIYDFKPDEKKMAKDKGIITSALGSMLGDMAKTYNAAALNFGKPVIMISKPLLRLLGDEEEKAVLAHEFAHAAARHNRVGLLQGITSGIAKTTASLGAFKEMLMAGFGGIVSAIGAAVAAVVIYKLAGKREAAGGLTKESVERKNREERVTTVIATAASVGILTWFNPLYLGAWAVSKTVSVAAKILNGHLHQRMEFQADRGAVDLGANPLALITALRKMETVMVKSQEKMLGGLPKKGFLTKAWQKATHSHPPTARRIARLSAIARKKGYAETAILNAVQTPVRISDADLLPPEVLAPLMKLKVA